MTKDRDVILKRRMFFVTSTLSLLGCPQENTAPPAVSPTTPVASVPQTDSGPLPSGPQPAEPSPVPPDKATKLPPLDIPSDASDTAKRHYEWQATAIPKIHKDIDQLDALTTSLCDIDDTACDKTWGDVAKLIIKIKEQRKDLEPRCGRGTTADAQRFNERLDAHLAAIDKRLAPIQQRLDQKLDTAARRNKWKAHQDANAPPRVCLKFACPVW